MWWAWRTRDELFLLHSLVIHSVMNPSVGSWSFREYWVQWRDRFLLEIHVKPDAPTVAVVEKFVLFALGWIAAIIMAFGFYR